MPRSAISWRTGRRRRGRRVSPPGWPIGVRTTPGVPPLGWMTGSRRRFWMRWVPLRGADRERSWSSPRRRASSPGASPAGSPPARTTTRFASRVAARVAATGMPVSDASSQRTRRPAPPTPPATSPGSRPGHRRGRRTGRPTPTSTPAGNSPPRSEQARRPPVAAPPVVRASGERGAGGPAIAGSPGERRYGGRPVGRRADRRGERGLLDADASGGRAGQGGGPRVGDPRGRRGGHALRRGSGRPHGAAVLVHRRVVGHRPVGGARLVRRRHRRRLGGRRPDPVRVRPLQAPPGPGPVPDRRNHQADSRRPCRKRGFTMSNNPEQIRHEIETTRAELSGDVNALADSVRPSTVARRQVDKVRDGVTTAKNSVKDSVMGTAEDAGQSVSGTAGDATSAVRRKTRGNPLAAGLVAFAAGWLVSSMLPASQAERQGAAALKEKAQPLADDLQSAARQVAESLKEPAREAVEQVKASAADSAATVKDEASSTAAGVKDSTRQAAEEVSRRS